MGDGEIQTSKQLRQGFLFSPYQHGKADVTGEANAAAPRLA
jgi:hypothetical protein